MNTGASDPEKPATDNDLLRKWLAALPGPITEVSLRTLEQLCFGAGRRDWATDQIREVAALLASMSYGMDPDPNRGDEVLDDSVFLFHLPSASEASAPASMLFKRAILISTVLAPSEPDPDAGIVVRELARRLFLNPAETTRLTARHWRAAEQPAPPRLVWALASKIPYADRAALGEMTATIAAACGKANSSTVAALERLHDAFGIERRSIYTILRRSAAIIAALPREPIVVEPAAPSRGGFRIPPPPATQFRLGPNAVVNMARVNAILRETSEVAAILADVFADEDASMTPNVTSAPTGQKIQVAALSAEHRRLLQELRNKDRWSRAEFEATAASYGLMANGAIETINEWAYEAIGDELIADGESLTIDLTLLDSLREKPE